MRIAHVTDCYLPRLGGIELQVRDLARRQQAIGHDVTVVTSVGADHQTGVAHGVLVRRPPRGRVSGADGAIHYAHSMSGRGIVLAGDYDVVHVHASTFSPLAFLAAQAASHTGIPTAVTVHSLWSYATPLFRLANELCRWARWPVAWSAVSTVAAQPLRRVLRDRAAVAVLPNGIDPAQWSRRRHARYSSDVRVVSVMRLAQRKRPRELLSMLRRVAHEVGPSVRLTADIIGDGPQRPMMERYVRRHDMGRWVNLAGRATRAQISEAFARADFFVAPATLESFGIAALEARSAGLPVVARAGTGIADFITHRREGLLASSDAEMIAAIVELVESPDLRARIAMHNRSVPPALTWEHVLARCTALYEAAALAQRNGVGCTAEPTGVLTS